MTPKPISREDRERIRHYAELCQGRVTEVSFGAIEDLGGYALRLLAAMEAGEALAQMMQATAERLHREMGWHGGTCAYAEFEFCSTRECQDARAALAGWWACVEGK